MTMRFSRRDALLRTAAAAAAGLIPGAPSLAAPPRLQFRNDQMEASLQAAVDAADVPGLVAMAATEHSVIYQGAFGVRSIGARATMSADTVFSIASMTKLLTSIAALQLVERGRIKLDEPAARLDPELASPQVLDGFDARGRRNCVPRASRSRCAICSRTPPGSAISFGTPMSFATARPPAAIRRCRARP